MRKLNRTQNETIQEYVERESTEVCLTQKNEKKEKTLIEKMKR